MKNEIVEMVYEAIDEINDLLSDDKKVSKSINTILYGSGSSLDSLGLVNLVVSTEQIVNEKYNSEITLADEKAMSLKNSPFRSVETLADYIVILLENK